MHNFEFMRGPLGRGWVFVYPAPMARHIALNYLQLGSLGEIRPGSVIDDTVRDLPKLQALGLRTVQLGVGPFDEASVVKSTFDIVGKGQGASLQDQRLTPDFETWAVGQITNGGPFTASLAYIGSLTKEVGQSVVSPQFNATYTNGPPESAILVDSEGNASQDVTASPNPITRAFTYLKTANNDSVVFSLSAMKAAETPVSAQTLAWRPLVFWGVGVAGGSTEAFIEALANNALASSRARSFTLTPANQKLYYAIPTSYGAATFTVFGFSGGFNAPTTISVTNAFGVVQNYDLYESSNLLTGSVPVVVS